MLVLNLMSGCLGQHLVIALVDCRFKVSLVNHFALVNEWCLMKPVRFGEMSNAITKGRKGWRIRLPNVSPD